MTMRQFDNDFIDFYLEQLGVAAFFRRDAIRLSQLERNYSLK